MGPVFKFVQGFFGQIRSCSRMNWRKRIKTISNGKKFAFVHEKVATPPQFSQIPYLLEKGLYRIGGPRRRTSTERAAAATPDRAASPQPLARLTESASGVLTCAISSQKHF